MTASLLLGPVSFQRFELPGRIAWGGSQRLTVHRLPGGARIIDAMGRDDTPITWSGIFSGGDGAPRARMLDVMRAEAAVWSLTWDAFYYSVVVSEFHADYARTTWIPYHITCTVLRDESAALVEAALSLTASALGDVNTAEAVQTGVDFSDPLTALAAPGATTRGTAAYGVALSELGTAANQLDASVTSNETELTTNTMGNSTAVLQAIGTAGQLALLLNAQGYLQRAQANLSNAST